MTVAELTAIVDDQLKAANARRTMRRDELSAIRFVPDFATIVTLDQSDFAVEDGCDIHVVSAADYLTKEGVPS